MNVINNVHNQSGAASVLQPRAQTQSGSHTGRQEK